ncbi:MAG: hypothetical protein WBL86_08125, partial [Pseudolabrys sp.]
NKAGDVRYWHLADIALCTERTLRACQECAKMKGGNLATVGSCYFTQSINGTAGRFGQFMTPVKESDN